MSAPPIVVKEYKSVGDFNEDAPRMAARGYVVQSQSERTRRSGCMRLLMMGVIFALIIKPKPLIVVTYQLQPPARV